jgi:5S rRNA maturation endonuclease (ribonuclease M5)
MENRVSEKTCVVEGRRDASTVEAMRAALVEREAGNLY